MPSTHGAAKGSATATGHRRIRAIGRMLPFCLTLLGPTTVASAVAATVKTAPANSATSKTAQKKNAQTQTAQAAPADPAKPSSAPAAAPAPAGPPAATPTPPPGSAVPPPPAPTAAPPDVLPGDPGPGADPTATDPALGGFPTAPEDIDVIKVTVDRREKRLQDYAGSASAFSQDDLERVNVTSVRELSNVSPSTVIGTQEGNTEIFIRGVGSANNTELGDPSAATHIDGVYIPRPRGVGAMFFDLERVEVNRGPQGTLRGRNAVAGSLNLITAKPKLADWGAEASVQLGNYAQRLTKAVVNVPLGNRLALRFASFSENRAPFFKNGGPIHTLEGGESADTVAYRATAKWLPLDNVSVIIGHDFTNEKGTGYSGSNFSGPLGAGLLPHEVPDPRRVIYRGPQGRQNTKHWGVHGDLGLDLGPVQIGYLGSYRNLDYRQVTPGNAGVVYPGMPAPDLDNWSAGYWHTTSKSHVHELRLYAPDTARFRWTIGGFAFRERQTAFLGTTADKSDAFAGVEFNMPDVKGGSEAGYFDGTLDILPFLRATGGIRYTRENKSRTGIGNVYGFDTMGMPFRFGTEGFRYLENRPTFDVGGMNAGSVFSAGIGQYGVRDTLGTGLASGAITAASWASVTPQRGTYEDKFIDFRAGLDADIAKGHLLYTMFTTGHASGGFNDNVVLMAPLPSIAPTYKPETLYALEVGSKNELLDRKLRLNVSAFWYEYRDMVLQTIRQISPPGADPSMAANSAVRSNVAKARILGAEIDGAWRLPGGFTAAISALLLQAKAVEGSLFDNRVVFGPSGDPNTDSVDISDNTLPRSPKVTVNYSLGYAVSTSVGWFDTIVSAQTRSKQYMTIFNGEGRDPAGNINPLLSDVVPRYTRLDLGIGYTRPDGKTRLDAFASNVTNATYMTTLINTPGLNLRFFNPPRQVGVRLTLYW